MSPPQTVGDPTDPKGTLQPNLPPEPVTGPEFKPLSCPAFAHQINLPIDVVQNDAFAIWSLFFSADQLETIVRNTNANGQLLFAPNPLVQAPHTQKWKDTSLYELYAYLAILICMGLHPENDIKLYWSQKPGMPAYTLI
jgi:hypothetical protein